MMSRIPAAARPLWRHAPWLLPLPAVALALTLGLRPGFPARSPPAPDAGTAPRAEMPLVFEENRGQSDEAVRFMAHGPHYSQFVTDRAVVWRLNAAAGDHAVYMTFPGSEPAIARGAAALPGRSNYLRGSDASKWVSGAQQYSAVLLQELYPGIDFKLYGIRSRAEYDFIVRPGAEPAAIRLRITGAETMLGETGELVVRTPAGELVHHLPVAYQLDADGRRLPVEAHFVRTGAGEFAFGIGAYDATRELVIDPVYEYSTYLGGSAGEAIQGQAAPDPWQGIAVDAAGQAYVAGITSSADFPVSAGPLQPASGGDIDFFVAKLNAAGDAILYSTYIGGSGDEIGIGGIAVSAAGELYLGGTSQSDDFPVTPGAYQTTKFAAGDTDVVALKLNATGDALVYSTYLGSRAGESLFGFAVDAAGSAYLAGSTVVVADLPFPHTAGALDTGGDQFLTKLAPDGSGLVYSARLGHSPGEVRIRAMALDTGGNVYLTGLTNSATALPLVNAYDSTLGGSFDAFVTKVNATGSGIVYSTYLGGSQVDTGMAIAVDPDGNAYVAGTTGNSTANDFPVTGGAYLGTPSTQYGGFVSKLNAAGSALTWSTYLGAPGASSSNAIALDSNRRVYVVTGGGSAAVLRADEAVESCLAAAGSPSVLRLSADGSRLEYGMRVGGSTVYSGSQEVTFQPVNDIAVDAGNNVYLTGSTNSEFFPTYHGVQGQKNGPSFDAYVAKLSDATPFPQPTLQFAAAEFSAQPSAGQALVVVNLTGRSAGPVMVRARTSDGSATSPADYTATDTILEWRNGDLAPKTFVVPLVDQAVPEDGKTVHLTLSEYSCIGDLGAQSTAALIIGGAGTSPPPGPPQNAGTLQLSASGYSAAESAGSVTIAITRVDGSSGTVSARLTTSDGTAATGADYTAVDTTVTFADGDTTAQTVAIPILQDTVDEPDETFNVALSAPTGGASPGTPSSATITITDDDSAPAPPSSGGTDSRSGNRGGGGSTDALLLLGLLALIAVRQAPRRGGPRASRGRPRPPA